MRDFVLCTTNLPAGMNNAAYQSLMKKFGSLECCFLMFSDNGRSLGYGFTEFTTKSSSQTAQNELANFVDEVQVFRFTDIPEDFNDLYSKCLLVDLEGQKSALPVIERMIRTRNYKTMSHWMVVEYNNAVEAEERCIDFLTAGFKTSFGVPRQRKEVLLLAVNAVSKTPFSPVKMQQQQNTVSNMHGSPESVHLNFSTNPLPSSSLGSDADKPRPVWPNLSKGNDFNESSMRDKAKEFAIQHSIKRW